MNDAIPDAGSGPGPEAGPGAPAAPGIDWEAEGRWHDTRPASFVAVTVVGCAVAAGVCWAAGNTGWVRVMALGLVLSVLGAWLNDRMMVSLQRRTGVSVRHAAVLLRHLRQERIPHDPRDRRVMAELVRMQIGRQRPVTGWAAVTGLAVFVLLAAFMLVAGHVVLAVGTGVLAVALIRQYRGAARVRARLARMERVLAEPDA
ncbi:hypothetical protein ACIP93_24760 [Streptomyces sp. NPDC088745]|uniref:hypothetical protein n=1 Tax=Streptomyces sp. NPDC088745 TaxID=3365884 RepID=UPI00382B6BB9